MATSESQVLALHLSRQGAERLRELVSGSPMSRLAGLENNLEEFERKAVLQQPDLLLVEFIAEDTGLYDMLERLRRSVPRGMVVAVSESKDPDLILTAMRLGVREFLSEPTSGNAFNDAVLRLRRQTQSPAQPAGKLISVMGVKGGVGTSHLALNLSWSLSQQQEQRVALVDLDLSGGDLSFLLDIEPTRHIGDVPHNFSRLDPLFMDSLLSEVAPGLRLLGAPPDPVAAEEVRADHAGPIMEYLADAHSVLVMDLPSRMDEVTLLALDRSDVILLAMEPTLVGLKAARRMLSLSQQLGHDQDKVLLVVNRYGSKSSLVKADVRKVLDRDILAWLPNDSRTLMQAGNAGRPVMRDWPRSPWAKMVTKLAEDLMDFLGHSAETKDQPESEIRMSE